ncbi:MAG: hypothetical protein JKX94_03725 [Sneathiella sp.]|nr:hypothetical protein [Sneathiella sp.]
MNILKIEIWNFPVPFNVVFRHASANRSHTQNIIVQVQCDKNIIGYGEGCPRDYVTKETDETARQFVKKHTAEITQEITSVETLRHWINRNRDEIDNNPAAFCALEIALLDAIGKSEKKTLEQILDLPDLEGVFSYSAVLGDSPLPVFLWQVYRYRQQKFWDFKVKVSGNIKRDRRKVRALKWMSSSNTRIRMDANNLWDTAAECVSHIKHLNSPVFAIEEPLKVGNISGFEAVSRECDTSIILDESFLRAEQLDALSHTGRWVINLRVSKMGGIIRSLDIARRATEKGIGLIIGAQVGETSILTRAALAISNAYRSNLIASEGAFGTILLKHDLTEPCLMFGKAGVLEINSLVNENSDGMGLHVNKDLLSEPYSA